ncbi:MAG: nucleoside monophosphate kinase [Patescibacteria group bacterium]
MQNNNQSKLQAYIFIGRSGCGKGTQSELLTKKLRESDSNIKILHIESGNELRKFAKEENYTAIQVKKILSEGGLMPEFIPGYLWGKLFVDGFTGNETLIFDGTPRKLLEAKILDSLFPFYDIDKPWVVYLDVNHEESTKRLKGRGRSDDTEEAIKRRMEWYENDVRPSVEFYRANPNVRFVDIDGHRPIDEVHADIVKKVGLV